MLVRMPRAGLPHPGRVARRMAVVALAVCVVLLLGGGAPGTPPAFAQTTSAPPAVAWSACGGGFECGTLDAPLDYGKPDGAQVHIALIRLPATDPAQRIGSILTDPGGPGASGVNFARAWARSLPAEIRARFDIVGFDPRGIGGSTPALVCHRTLQQLVAADPDPQTSAAWDEVFAVSRAFADDCAQQYPDLLPHLGSMDVTRDMERIRQALGEAKLTYVGFSYGTVLGQLYANAYPDRVRAIVLDGPVDVGLTPDEFSAGQAAGFEQELNRFLAQCTQESGCPLAFGGADPRDAIPRVLAAARQQPIPAPGADRPAGPGEVLLGVVTALYRPETWPTLATALSHALKDDGTALVRLTDDYLGRGPNGYSNEMEMNAAVNCLDYAYPRDRGSYIDLALALSAKWPTFGGALASEGVLCAVWPVAPEPLPRVHPQGAPPILVVGTTRDPATPFSWALGARAALPSGVLLTRDGDGHTAYGENACVDTVVDAYLLTLAVPQDGAVCGVGAQPSAPPTPPAQASVAPPTPPAVSATAASATARAGASGTPASPGVARRATRRVGVFVGATVVLAAVLVSIAGGLWVARRRRPSG